MGFDKESASSAARKDLAARLKVNENEIKVKSVTERDFPDMSLGAPESGEVSAQMIATGWEISLETGGKNYQYRADKYQLRVKGFEGKNHRVRA